jgi:hypothetical protein
MTLQYLGYVVLMRDCYDWFRSLRGLLVVEGIAIGAVLGVRLLGLHWALTTAIVLGGYAVAAYLARCVATKDLGILLAGAPAPAGQAPEAIDDLQESKLND